MNILLLLGLLTLTVPAPVHAADKSGEPPAIRYFQYWVRYGEKAARPGGYGSLSFELEKNRMNVFAPEPAGNFCGPADSSVIRDFSVLAAGLDLTDWAGESGKDPFSLPEKEREKSCVWSLTIIFAENGRGNAPGKIRISVLTTAPEKNVSGPRPNSCASSQTKPGRPAPRRRAHRHRSCTA